MTKQTQTLRLIDFHDRHMHVLLKSGTMIPDLEITGTDATDGKGNLLPTPLIYGIDKWGNEHSIGTDYIQDIAFLDTIEQRQLKASNFLIETYSKIPNLDETPILKQSYEDTLKTKAELEAKGVTLYVPVREDI